jgi:hypothetical protein
MRVQVGRFSQSGRICKDRATPVLAGLPHQPSGCDFRKRQRHSPLSQCGVDFPDQIEPLSSFVALNLIRVMLAGPFDIGLRELVS